MPLHRFLLPVVVAGCLASGACETRRWVQPAPDIWTVPDRSVSPPRDAGCQRCSNPAQDDDRDGIPNGEEGCRECRDTDRDGIPDWQDSDSDGDKIMDVWERGQRDSTGRCRGRGQPGGPWPCHSDTDGLPDYLDTDSDADGLLDGEEDTNTDGLLGCCLDSCHNPRTSWQRRVCPLRSDGCSRGQTCSAGDCLPARAFDCSAGETDPYRPDTFGDGRPDTVEHSFICMLPTVLRPQGRKTLLEKSHERWYGDWSLAFERGGQYRTPTLINRGTEKTYAAVINHDLVGEQVAAFVTSRATTRTNVQDELSGVVPYLLSTLPPGGNPVLTNRSQGVLALSHDLFWMVRSRVIEIRLPRAYPISAIRDIAAASTLQRPVKDLGGWPATFGPTATRMVLHLTVVRRVEHRIDPRTGKVVLDDKGNPVESGDKSRWRVVALGALAPLDAYLTSGSRTRTLVDDLANSTALSIHDSKLQYRCAAFTAAFTSGNASLELDHVPASASLAVTLDGRDLQRAQPTGFDYDPTDNTLKIHSQTHTKGRVVVSYQQWEKYNPPF
jgi:hypothetical protein